MKLARVNTSELLATYVGILKLKREEYIEIAGYHPIEIATNHRDTRWPG
jgi:hypothetical protein